MNPDHTGIHLKPRDSRCHDVNESPVVRESESDREKRSTILELPPVSESGAGQIVDAADDVEPRAAVSFRPLRRPPMAVLCAHDDGRDGEGETWRVRTSEFVIGRIDGDVVIPHDRDISARHAEIGYRWQDGCFRWSLRDLGSTNGTFIRVSRIVLKSGQQIILGSRRYQFADFGHAGGSASVHDDAALRETRDYRPPEEMLLSQNSPRLVEVNAGDSARSIPLCTSGGYIGADSNRCMAAIPEDPFVGPADARFFRDSRGRCVIEDCRSQNGLWLRIQNVELSATTGFQLGEQRFTIEIL